MAFEVSEWANAKFGKDAEAVALAAVRGLHAAHASALGAHIGGGLPTADAYGSVLWLSASAEILARVAKIEGSRRIKPDRARYSLGVVNNQVILPQRIATDLRKSPTEARLPMSRVKADRFSLGPTPPPRVEHPALFDDDGAIDRSQEPTLEDRPNFGEAGLVLVAYVSSPDGGLLRAWWGEAALLDDGHLDWQYREPLDLSQAVLGRPDLQLVGNRNSEPTARRFSDAPPEETPLSVRNPLTAPSPEPQQPAAPTGSGIDE